MIVDIDRRDSNEIQICSLLNFLQYKPENEFQLEKKRRKALISRKVASRVLNDGLKHLTAIFKISRRF